MLGSVADSQTAALALCLLPAANSPAHTHVQPGAALEGGPQGRVRQAAAAAIQSVGRSQLIRADLALHPQPQLC